MDKETQQHFLEVMSYTEACSVSQDRNMKHVENGAEYNLAYAQDIIQVIIPEVEKYIRDLYTRRNQHVKPFFWNWIKPQYLKHKEDVDAKVSKQMMTPDPATKIAEIVAVLLTANLSKGVMLTEISMEISNATMQAFNVPFMNHSEWRTPTMNFITPIIMEVSEKTDIFTIEQIAGREKRLVLSKQWEEKVKEIQDNFGLNVSKYKPMIVKPTPHTNLVDGNGGYRHSESPLLKYPVRIDGKIHPFIRNFNAKTQPAWFDRINKAQETAFQVNKPLYNLILEYYKRKKKTFKDFPLKKDKVTAYKEATKEIEKREKKRKVNMPKYGKEYTPMLNSTLNKIIKAHDNAAVETARKTKALFEQCKLYEDEPEIFFPIFVDYRGRRYPYANTSLSYQGDELSKAMLVFANKKQITEEGEQVMYETLANTMGLDKRVCEQKVEYAKEFFLNNLVDFLNDKWDIFFDDSHKDEDAGEVKIFEEPITALSICYELVQFVKDPEYYTGLICHRDARCSGASIIGTVMRDKGVMEMTSVIDYADEYGFLGDAYKNSAEKALEICQKRAEKGDQICCDLEELSDKLFTRKAFKHVVMV